MKKDIHPKVHESVIKCACGATFETKSTEKEIHVEICSNCHPFFSHVIYDVLTFKQFPSLDNIVWSTYRATADGGAVTCLTKTVVAAAIPLGWGAEP